MSRPESTERTGLAGSDPISVSLSRPGALLYESFELRRRQIAEELVQAHGAEPGGVFDDRELVLGAGAPDGSAISSVLKVSTKLSAKALS
jgi:hypothetical protein